MNYPTTDIDYPPPNYPPPNPYQNPIQPPPDNPPPSENRPGEAPMALPEGQAPHLLAQSYGVNIQPKCFLTAPKRLCEQPSSSDSDSDKDVGNPDSQGQKLTSGSRKRKWEDDEENDIFLPKRERNLKLKNRFKQYSKIREFNPYSLFDHPDYQVIFVAAAPNSGKTVLAFDLLQKTICKHARVILLSATGKFEGNQLFNKVLPERAIREYTDDLLEQIMDKQEKDVLNSLKLKELGEIEPLISCLLIFDDNEGTLQFISSNTIKKLLQFHRQFRISVILLTQYDKFMAKSGRLMCDNMIIFYDKRASILENILNQYLGYKEDWQKMLFSQVYQKYCLGVNKGCLVFEWRRLTKILRRRDRYNLFSDTYFYKAEDWKGMIERGECIFFHAGTLEYWLEIATEEEREALEAEEDFKKIYMEIEGKTGSTELTEHETTNLIRTYDAKKSFSIIKKKGKGKDKSKSITEPKSAITPFSDYIQKQIQAGKERQVYNVFRGVAEERKRQKFSKTKID
jgi:A32 protein